MPAQAPAAVAESTPAKREAESIEAKAIEQPLAPAADSARQETASRAATGNSFRQSNLPPAAKLITANRLAPAEIFNGNLILRADDDNKIYAFLIDGESIKPLSTENDLRRSIPLGTHSAKAEVWLLITATEDPVLARALAGVLPLPSRAWIKLKTNP